MIRRLHHVGISVKSLERSKVFYCGVLGMRLIDEGVFNGGAMDRITRLEGTQGRAAMLRIGDLQVELFEFAAPTPKNPASSRAVCDYGISHFCIEVTDLKGEYERLRRAGVEFHCAPQAFGSMSATYALDPDGNVFELLEVPNAQE